MEPKIDKVIYNGPATTIVWSDGAKTTAKRSDYDIHDPEKGFAMAFVKRFMPYSSVKDLIPTEDELKHARFSGPECNIVKTGRKEEWKASPQAKHLSCAITK